MNVFLQGFAIGFAIAVPVGPIALLCIRRTIIDGRIAGFVTGLGAATADTIFGVIVALGLTAILDFLQRHHGTIQLIGGIFLVIIGILNCRAKAPVASNAQPVHARNLTVAYFTTTLLTLANPITIVAFIALFSTWGLSADSRSLFESGWLIAGVFLGSALWWLLLTLLARWLGGKLNERSLRIINIVSGIAIGLIGVWQLVQLCLVKPPVG